MDEQPNSGDLPSEPQGVLGDGALQPGRYNMRLIRRAIREDWPLSPETRKLVVEQMGDVVRLGKTDRNKIGAALVLVAADGVNVKRERLDVQVEQPQAPTTAVQVNVNFGDAVRELIAHRTTVAGGEAGLVGQLGEPRALENGHSPEPPGGETNGHRNGHA